MYEKGACGQQLPCWWVSVLGVESWLLWGQQSRKEKASWLAFMGMYLRCQSSPMQRILCFKLGSMAWVLGTSWGGGSYKALEKYVRNLCVHRYICSAAVASPDFPSSKTKTVPSPPLGPGNPETQVSNEQEASTVTCPHCRLLGEGARGRVITVSRMVWKLRAPQSCPPPFANSSRRQILIAGVTARSCHHSIFIKNIA